MRQIPSEVLLCGECCCKDPMIGTYCWRYGAPLQFNGVSRIRLANCLHDKPQVLTEKDREALILKGERRGIDQMKDTFGEVFEESVDLQEGEAP